ncbi:response regulator receiver sensor signal transduction histidine kinase [Malonomonas rubra DSM 5091]|uniref:histidine kinase n=1 Tax=Malonomonas rubra DSM 5091 TaxID=1122189 RepID=A0A1M6DJ62_MALRU|nr:hybrid sensor histidine kinase/response regulator [Malonomonas rubra]SHI73296.1 response regulator receiver sensor signal transduction histidine kinase [Malonomonas rubra DSM 5091]
MTIEKSRFAGEKVLLVDDEEVILELTSLLLRKRGFEVLLARNGEECVRMVAEHHPALVLLDYMMPVMNGFSALKQIKINYPDTYVIMFTGKGSEEVAVEVMKAGASDYLQKPFSNKNLQERIDSILMIRKVELENHNLLREREFLQREIEEWNRELEQRVVNKSRELELAHKEIIQSEKLATLGHISAGMAHEIRNPLNSINLFAQILMSAPELDEENRNYVTKITQEVERIDQILLKMLAASKGEGEKLERVNLVNVIHKVLSDYKVQIDAQKIDVDCKLDASAPEIEADPVEMEQIFTNLISNALFEMQDGGRLGLVMISDAESLIIKVADSGRGIPTENLARLFDPFFTTKEKGTGFGLSVVLRIIKGYGGKISVDSAPGEGATFIVELPLLPSSVH